VNKLLSIFLLIAVITAIFAFSSFYSEAKNFYNASVLLQTEPISEDSLWREIQMWRVSTGKEPYLNHSFLCSLAEKRAYEITVLFSHKGFRDADAFSLAENPFNYLGENLLKGPSSSNKIAFEAWLRSSTHRYNLENPDYTHSCLKCVDEYCAHIFGGY
jgi:hypothetical protein